MRREDDTVSEKVSFKKNDILDVLVWGDCCRGSMAGRYDRSISQRMDDSSHHISGRRLFPGAAWRYLEIVPGTEYGNKIHGDKMRRAGADACSFCVYRLESTILVSSPVCVLIT